MLRPIKTMCCVCTKVLQGTDRQNTDDWGYEPHSYSHDYSHGYCPPCMDEALREVDEHINGKK